MKEALKILMLSDSVETDGLINKLLKKEEWAFEFKTVNNRKNYLKVLQDYQPDIILADHTISQFSSADALENMLKQTGHIPFIIITTVELEESAIELLKKGADDYVLNFKRLPLVIEKVIKNWQVIDNEKKKQQEIISTFERITDAFVALDKNWCYTYMNGKAGKIFNRDPKKIIGKHIWTEFPEGIDQSFYKAYYQAMEEQKYIHVEEYYPPYDQWFENHIYPSPVGLSIFFRDITEAKKSEQAIKGNEAKYRSLFENSADAILLTSTDGKFCAANPAACQLFERTEEEICASGREAVVDMTDPRLKAFLEERKKMGKAKAELTYKRKSGELFQGEVSSSVFTDASGEEKTSMIIRDITKRKKVEGELANSESRLRTILDTEPECVKLLNKKGELLEMNPAGLAMIEAENLEQVHGHLMTDLIVPKYKIAFGRLINEVFEGRAGTLEFEIIGLKGSHRWLETHAVPLKDSAGKIISLLGITRDVTESKKAETKILKLNQELEQRVKERTAELETANKDLEEINDLFVGREARIIELKEELEALKKTNKTN